MHLGFFGEREREGERIGRKYPLEFGSGLLPAVVPEKQHIGWL
jgi:hypothetical protein